MIDWKILAGSLELTGNILACTVALLWGSIALYVNMYKVSGLLYSISVMAFTNACYALMYILANLPEQYTTTFWGSPFESTVLWMQQVASISIPIFAILTWWSMFKDRKFGIRKKVEQ